MTSAPAPPVASSAHTGCCPPPPGAPVFSVAVSHARNAAIRGFAYRRLHRRFCSAGRDRMVRSGIYSARICISASRAPGLPFILYSSMNFLRTCARHPASRIPAGTRLSPSSPSRNSALLLPTVRKWVFRNLGGTFQARGLITRRLSNSNPARPYICRFSIFRRFTCPSTTPLPRAKQIATLGQLKLDRMRDPDLSVRCRKSLVQG